MVAETAAPGRDLINRRAAAKINLYLHVTGKRADGFHLLDSLIVFVDMGDDLEVAPADDLTLVLEGPFGPELGRAGDDQDNLVIRAARLLQEKRRDHPTAGAPGARIRLVKNLPVAAGVGGGSADAAAAIEALSALWNLRLPVPDLMALGLQLGADVPACLAGAPVLVSGIGEGLTPAPMLPDFHVVLVNPGVALSTARVFGALTPGAYGPARPLDQPVPDMEHLIHELGQRRNDLEGAAIKLAPEIAQVLQVLEDVPGCRFARMSGSGATCFGIFADAPDAARAAQQIKTAYPDWWASSGAVQLHGDYG